MRGPAVGVRDGVVDVAIECGPIAAGPPAGEIPAAHEIGELLRRHISRLGRGIDRDGPGHQLGPGGQLGNEFGCDEPVSAYLGCRCAAAAVDRGLFGDHVNHHRCCGGPFSSGAVAESAATAQPIGARRERSQPVSAALLARAWIVLAHRAGQRSEPLVQGMRIGAQQAAVNFRQAALRGRRTRPRVQLRRSVRRRTASASALATILSICPASRPRVIDGQRTTVRASCPSTVTSTSRSVIRSVR